MKKYFHKEFKVETELSIEEIVKRLNNLKLFSKERYSDGLAYANSTIYGCISGKIDSEGFRFSTFARRGIEFPVIAKGSYSKNSKKTVIDVTITPVKASLFLLWVIFCFLLVLSYFSLANIGKCDSIFCDQILILSLTAIFPFLTTRLFTHGSSSILEMMLDVLEAKEIKTE